MLYPQAQTREAGCNPLFGLSIGLAGSGGTGGGNTPANAYVAENGATFYVAEDGATFYVQES